MALISRARSCGGAVATCSALQEGTAESQALDRRRARERAFVRQRDAASADVWYLIDAQWLEVWKDFVGRGGALPGPIDNSRLVDGATGTPKRGLLPTRDYRGLSAVVWHYFLRQYGGGPEVARRELNLYAPEADPLLEVESVRIARERAAEERAFVRRHDSATADVWYLVDVEWLATWKRFVTGHGELPGPIDNSRLVNPRTGAPNPGLQASEDYRGVNSDVWQFWLQRYGGGPCVRRRVLELYSPTPEAFPYPGADSASAKGALAPRSPDAQGSRSSSSSSASTDLGRDACCSICLDAPKTHAFVPCGHQCVCARCADSLSSLDGACTCPLCRVPAFMVIKIIC